MGQSINVFTTVMIGADNVFVGMVTRNSTASFHHLFLTPGLWQITKESIRNGLVASSAISYVSVQEKISGIRLQVNFAFIKNCCSFFVTETELFKRLRHRRFQFILCCAMDTLFCTFEQSLTKRISSTG